VGWVLGKKSVLTLIYGRTFDQACREQDWVYRQSAAMRTTGADRRPEGNPPPLGEDKDAAEPRADSPVKPYN
jgi:hypothetical protein